jgi:pimeloyl-ACP methyl ester carboxylesterase
MEGVKMNLDAKTIRKYFDGVSDRDLQEFRDFLNDHPLKFADYRGVSVPYYILGEGEKTILTFSGGHSGPWAVYGTALGFEKEFRIVVVDLTSCDSLDELNGRVNHVLDLEGVGPVCLIGQSLSGIFAQAYFRRNAGRVEAMVLTNTLAPKKERNKKAAFIAFRIFPSFLLIPLLKNKLAKVGKIDASVSPEIEERLRFRMALLRHDLDRVARKKALLGLIRLIFEFNEKDALPKENIDRWPGKVLIVTSEDEPYREDVESLKNLYPHNEVFSFPAGWRHAAPMIHREKFQNLIRDFLLYEG